LKYNIISIIYKNIIDDTMADDAMTRLIVWHLNFCISITFVID